MSNILPQTTAKKKRDSDNHPTKKIVQTTLNRQLQLVTNFWYLKCHRIPKLNFPISISDFIIFDDQYKCSVCPHQQKFQHRQ